MSPLELGEMTLYELLSMNQELAKLDKTTGGGELMSDEQFEASKQRWRDMNLPDVRIN